VENRKQPFIITLAHEKGGTGKSTLATHLAIGLMYYNKDFKIALLDLDNRQLSSFNFFQNRQQYGANVPNLTTCQKIDSSISDSKKNAYNEDFQALEYTLYSLNHCDFIIVDTAGSYNNFTIAAVHFCDLLITPVTESHFDIDAIVQLKKYEKNILNGPFYEIVFEQRKALQIANKAPFEWMIVINRASSLYQENSENCKEILNTLSKNLNFNVQYIIKDRNVYKELCNHGLTIFDLPNLVNDLGMMKIKAHAEMDKFIFTVIKFFEDTFGMMRSQQIKNLNR
jgi:cellulose biosynthesis protein BcsQ